ncbi:hypothetical protein MSG28_005573 [Choristoneura fumiferana]|uniref:Uncharacterized protein n=1 Tax=Choristoneura fumiferana TaxID=7141 RepID=A0ACC0KZG9_CHOFU|nr:hypothetical protein MSG28_005573 [Choristoneura fumiferana]
MSNLSNEPHDTCANKTATETPGPPTLNDNLTPHYQSSNTDLESLGRTPPVSRHFNRHKQKETNEDCGSTKRTDPSTPQSNGRMQASLPALQQIAEAIYINSSGNERWKPPESKKDCLTKELNVKCGGWGSYVKASRLKLLKRLV